MKKGILFALSIMLIACKNDVLSGQENYEAPNNSELIEDAVGGNSSIDYDKIRLDIIDWFKENSKDENEEVRWEILKDENNIELHAYLDEISSEIPDHTVYLSLDPSNYISGDLNEDNVVDLLVNANIEFGASGATFHTFLFLGSKDGFIIDQIFEQSYFEYCSRLNYWQPISIENSQINGIASCYSADDPACCPSLKVKTKSKFKDGEIELISKE